MAAPEINGIQAEIERLVKDSYRNGYEACRADLARFLEGTASPQVEPVTAARQPSGEGPGRKVAERRAQIGAQQSAQMVRGVANVIVEQIMRDFGARAVSQLEIIQEAERRDGTVLAYTTLRRTLDKLVRAGVVEQVAGTKAWRAKDPDPVARANVLRMPAKGDGSV